MTYTVENSLADFPAWSGAVHTLDILIEKGLCDTVEACLIDALGEYPMPTETEINDFLWFETDAIAEWCGFSSWEALENGEEEDEEEEEEEPEENNFSRWCANQSRDCSGCPYQKFHHLSDCETVYYHCQKFLHLSDCEAAYYHDHPEDDDDIRLYQ